jgi:hypothetical protein
MGMNFRSIRIETSYELPVLFWVEVLLAFDDYYFVGPDCLFESLHVFVGDVV